jgi:hypothetical protein
MANDWIKMRADLFSHPKTVRIMSALNSDNLRTVGGLMSAWCLFDVHSDEGQLVGYSKKMLDRHLGWEGFSEEMERVGWLVSGNIDGMDCLELPRFSTHNGKSAKLRAEDAERKRTSRASAKRPEYVLEKTDKIRTREEKRTEEKKEEYKEREIEGSNQTLTASPNRPTLAQAIAAGSNIGIAPDKAQAWWEMREASGWVKGTAGGGTTPVGTNWQADLKTCSSRTGSFLTAPSAQNGTTTPEQVKAALGGRFDASKMPKNYGI